MMKVKNKNLNYHHYIQREKTNNRKDIFFNKWLLFIHPKQMDVDMPLIFIIKLLCSLAS